MFFNYTVLEYCEFLCRWTTCSDSVLVFLKDYVEPLLEEIAPVGVGECVFVYGAYVLRIVCVCACARMHVCVCHCVCLLACLLVCICVSQRV